MGHRREPEILRVDTWLLSLAELFGEVFGAQVCIPFEHPQILMSGNGGGLHDIEALFKEAAGAFVSTVVKPNIHEIIRVRLLPGFLALGFVGFSCPFDSTDEGLSHCVWLGGKDAASGLGLFTC